MRGIVRTASALIVCAMVASCSDCSGGNRAIVDAGAGSDVAPFDSGPGVIADLADLRVHLVIGSAGTTTAWLWDESVKDPKDCPLLPETTVATLGGAVMTMTAKGGRATLHSPSDSLCIPVSFTVPTPPIVVALADGGAISGDAGTGEAILEMNDGSKTATLRASDLFVARKLAFVNHSPRFKPGDKIVVSYWPADDVLVTSDAAEDPTDISSMSEGHPRLFEMIIRSHTALKDVREKASGKDLQFEGELTPSKVEGTVPVGPVDIDFAWSAVFLRHAKVAKCEGFRSCAATPTVPPPIKIELTR